MLKSMINDELHVCKSSSKCDLHVCKLLLKCSHEMMKMIRLQIKLCMLIFWNDIIKFDWY